MKSVASDRWGVFSVDVPSQGPVVVTIALNGCEPEQYVIDRALFLALFRDIPYV